MSFSRMVSSVIMVVIFLTTIGCTKKPGSETSAEEEGRVRAEAAFRERQRIHGPAQISSRRLSDHEANMRKLWSGLDSIMLFEVQRNPPSDTTVVTSPPFAQMKAAVIGVKDRATFSLGNSTDADSQFKELLRGSTLRVVPDEDLEAAARSCIFLTTGNIVDVYTDQELKAEVRRLYDFATGNPKVAGARTDRWMAEFRKAGVTLRPSLDRTEAKATLYFPRITSHLGYESFEGPDLEILRVELEPTNCKTGRSRLLRLSKSDL